MEKEEKTIDTVIKAVFSKVDNADLSKSDIRKLVEEKIKITQANKVIFNEIYKKYHDAELNYGENKKTIKKTMPIFKKITKNFDVENNIVLLNNNNAKIITKILSEDEDYLDFAHKMYQGIVENEKTGLINLKEMKIKSWYMY